MSIIANQINFNLIECKDIEQKEVRSLRKRRAQQALNNTSFDSEEASLETAFLSSQKFSDSCLKREAKDENKRYKTRDEISFLEQQLIEDPSWSRKTVQRWKKVLGMKTEQIYKWGYDRKKAITKYKQLFPESNGFKTRFSNFTKEIDSNDLNQVVGSILDSMKHYRVFTQPKAQKEKWQETDPSLETESIRFHFDDNDNVDVLNFWQKSNWWDDYSSEVIGLNEQSMKLSTNEYFDDEVYKTLNGDNYF